MNINAEKADYSWAYGGFAVFQDGCFYLQGIGSGIL